MVILSSNEDTGKPSAVIVIRIVSFLSHANVFCQSIRISYTLLHKTRIVLQDLGRVVRRWGWDKSGMLRWAQASEGPEKDYNIREVLTCWVLNC